MFWLYTSEAGIVLLPSGRVYELYSYSSKVRRLVVLGVAAVQLVSLLAGSSLTFVVTSAHVHVYWSLVSSL